MPTERTPACSSSLAHTAAGTSPIGTSDAAEGNVLDQTIDDPERFGEVTAIELEAGEISMHSDLLLHGSEDNRSDRRRLWFDTSVLLGRRAGRVGLESKGRHRQR